MRSIIVFSSHHHGNTEKVAWALAGAPGADVTRPEDVDPRGLGGIPVAVAGETTIATYATRSHAELRERLVSRGYVVMGEFSCAGHNTNSFLRLFGGANKGRPGAGDLARAQEFARTLAGVLGKTRTA